jgi:Holliday junction resolvase-like predicted endonuclease
VRIGRYEADRVERRASGKICLIEVRSRPTIELALNSVDRIKQRRLAVMAKDLASRTGKPVTVEVEAVVGLRIVRKALGTVYPDVSDHI